MVLHYEGQKGKCEGNVKINNLEIILLVLSKHNNILLITCSTGRKGTCSCGLI